MNWCDKIVEVPKWLPDYNDDALFNMYDIKMVLERHNLLDEPKDNEGTECTLRMIVDDTIKHLENIARVIADE
tara:strand:+ start:1082 stop:1300 length:219 start_codon:yes stop_codon:yes gene_type:complete